MLGVVPVRDESSFRFSVEKISVPDKPPHPWKGSAFINGLLLIDGNVQRPWNGEHKGFAGPDHISHAFKYLVHGHNRGLQADSLTKADAGNKRRRLAIVGKDKLYSKKLAASDLLRVGGPDPSFRVVRPAMWYPLEDYLATSDVGALNMHGGLGGLGGEIRGIGSAFRVNKAFVNLPKLPYEKPRLDNTDQDKNPGENDEGEIGRRFFVAFLICLGGLVASLYGVELDNKRRRLSTALIGLGTLLIGAGLLSWWALSWALL